MVGHFRTRDYQILRRNSNAWRCLKREQLFMKGSEENTEVESQAYSESRYKLN